MYCCTVLPARLPWKERRGPVAGWYGFCTSTLAGLVAPLLAMYWLFQVASVLAGKFCRSSKESPRVVRWLEKESAPSQSH